VPDLIELAAFVTARARESSYKQEFAWINNFTPVSDEDVVRRVRSEVIHQLLSDPQSTAVDVLIPDDLLPADDERTIHYIALPGERIARAANMTLTISMVSRLVVEAAANGNPEAALNLDLRLLDGGRALLGTAQIDECLCAEVSLDDDKYVLYDGDVYKIEPAFVDGIDQEVGRLRESSIDLPCYGGGDEGVYNRTTAQERPAQLVLLDRALIRLPGETGVEACDLVDKCGALIHVKRKGKSSVLSHLFFQAGNSCDVLTRVPEARRQLGSMIEAAALDEDVVQMAEAALSSLGGGGRQIEVVFAFLGDWLGRSIKNLPLLSRISRAQTAHRIEQMGFVPTIKLVDICR
jgi:uncharacterized protein (TIGR04141 family)